MIRAFVPPQDRIFPGVLLMLGFCALAPLIDVAAKMAAQTVGVTQITFFRLVFQALLMAPFVLLLRQSLRMRSPQAWLVVLRALMVIGSTWFFVAAVAVMPIADALAILFVEPFILLALGFLLFGEKVGMRRIMASIVGFAGALLVIQPNFNAVGVAALFPLATAVFFALYMLITRHLSRQMPPEAMQFHTAWIGAALMLPALGLGHLAQWPALSLSPAPAYVLGLLFAVGLAATVAHILITYALRLAPSATLAPLHYLEIISAVSFGWLFFGDWPNPLSWAGIVVITGSGLYIIAREQKLSRQSKPRRGMVDPSA